MELSRIIEIVRFKKTAGNGIQSPSIEEAQELAREYLIVTSQAHVLIYKDPDPDCPDCHGAGVIEQAGEGRICDCAKLPDPIYIIPEAAPAQEDVEPLPEQEQKGNE